MLGRLFVGSHHDCLELNEQDIVFHSERSELWDREVITRFEFFWKLVGNQSIN